MGQDEPNHGYDVAYTQDLMPMFQECCETLRIPTKQEQETIHDEDDDDDDDDEDDEEVEWVIVLNYEQGTKRKRRNFHNDPWLDEAYDLRQSIISTSQMLMEKGNSYANMDLLPAVGTESEALEATVVSFMVHAANKVEKLRQNISSSPVPVSKLKVNPYKPRVEAGLNDVVELKQGIVEALLMELRHSVALPMEELQALKNRPANKLLQNPLTCKYEEANYDHDDDLFGDNENFKAFDYDPISSRDTLALCLESFVEIHHSDAREDEVFNSAYDEPLHQQAADIRKRREEEKQEAESFSPQVVQITQVKQANAPIDRQHEQDQIRAVMSQQPPQELNPVLARQEEEEMLQEEHILLTETLKNQDLEDAQKMEQTMVHIVALLNQFSNLLSQQHESVLLVEEHAKSSQQYVQYGQDKLVEATERKAKSAHRMAKLIVAMALLLLFFNYVTP